AGLVGSPGLGYAKDRFASAELERAKPAVYSQYKVTEPKGWLFFGKVYAIDGKKLGDVQHKLGSTREELAKTGVADPQAALAKLSTEERTVLESSITGDRKTLVADSLIPATMACIYLALLLYFKAIGGYKVVHIAGAAQEAKSATYPVQSPA